MKAWFLGASACVVVAALWLWAVRDPFVNAAMGVVAGEPVQTKTETPPFDFQNFDLISRTYRIQPLADYQIAARVLHTKHYHTDRYSAGLVPFDMGLGWNVMSDPSILATYFSFNHKGDTGGGRFLWTAWNVEGKHKRLPPEIGDPMTMISNNHLIPANKKIFRQIANVGTGDLVRLKGMLVDVSSPDDPNFHWQTSVSRTDTATHWGGNNTNCETIFVTSVERITSVDPLVTEPFPECWWCW